MTDSDDIKLLISNRYESKRGCNFRPGSIQVQFRVYSSGRVPEPNFYPCDALPDMPDWYVDTSTSSDGDHSRNYDNYGNGFSNVPEDGNNNVPVDGYVYVPGGRD